MECERLAIYGSKAARSSDVRRTERAALPSSSNIRELTDMFISIYVTSTRVSRYCLLSLCNYNLGYGFFCRHSVSLVKGHFLSHKARCSLAFVETVLSLQRTAAMAQVTNYNLVFGEEDGIVKS